MDKQFVLNHLHGYLGSFEDLMANWSPEEETLVVMGNILDYGQNAYLVYNRLFELAQEFPDKVVFLKGRHEVFFEKFIKNPTLYAEEFLENGGLSTLASFSTVGIPYEDLQDDYLLIENYLKDIDFSSVEIYINQCQSFYETESAVFISQENRALQSVLKNEWFDFAEKSLFLSTGEDERFKTSYVSFYFSETLERMNHEEGFLKGKINTSNVLPAAETALVPDNPFGHLPIITAYKIENGVIQETIESIANN